MVKELNIGVHIPYNLKIKSPGQKIKMSHPITHCMLREALDKKDWTRMDEIMEYNRSWGAFSIFECRGHLFKKRCSFTKEEEEIINEHLKFKTKE